MTHQTAPKPTPRLPDPFRRPPKRRPWLWVAIAALVALMAAPAIWQASKNSAPTTHTVIYSADAEGARGVRTGAVTLQSPTGSQQADVNLPMLSKNGSTGITFTFKSGDFLYLSVQNRDSAGGVTCRITVDGYVLSENTSTGAGAIATCKATVPK